MTDTGRAGLLTRMRPARPRTRSAVLVVVIAALLMLAGIIGVAAHYRAPGRAWVLGVSAFSPYLMLGAPVALVLLAVGREWVGALVALVITAVALATQIPLYTSASAPTGSRAFTTMTANLRLGTGNAADVVAAVRRRQVDALMVQELTAEEQQRLIDAGLDRVLPFHVSDPRPYAYGTGLWSRYPIRDEHQRYDFTCAFVSASVQVPDLNYEPTLVALHMAGPWPDSANWHRDIALLPGVLREIATAGAVIVGGDFNSTPDVAQFRTVLAAGYQDGASQAGAGFTRTYPSNRWYPPLIAIDHVLTRHAVATSVKTVEIPGSDHRALVVRVALLASLT